MNWIGSRLEAIEAEQITLEKSRFVAEAAQGLNQQSDGVNVLWTQKKQTGNQRDNTVCLYVKRLYSLG
jgi:hypothetical protein